MRRWHIRKRFPQPDWSIVDLWVARHLLSQGRPAIQIQAILRLASPHFPRRHGDPEDYLRRTVAPQRFPPQGELCACHVMLHLPRRWTPPTLVRTPPGAVTQRRVQPLLVIDLVDETRQQSSRFGQVAVLLPIHFFVLQGFHPRLAAPIFPGARLVTHADFTAMGLQQVGVISRSILAAAIGMMHQTNWRVPQLQRHAERRQRQFVFRPPVQRPPNHAPRKGVDHHRQVHKLRLQPNVRDIGHPKLVDPLGA